MKPENRIAWSSCARTHTGNVRHINQDALANLPEKNLWVVADGMGGHKDGAIASNEIINMFKQFEPEKTIGATATKIYQQLDSVNQSLINQAEQLGKNEIIGSTVAILYANQYRCLILWSGDSRIYLFRAGKLKQLTRDHNNESTLLAEGLSLEEIKIHPYAQTLTHAIGGEKTVFLDVQTQEIRHGDIFLLCSDGLNKEVSDLEIENILGQMPCQNALNTLIDLSLKREGRDNVTIILAQVCIKNKMS